MTSVFFALNCVAILCLAVYLLKIRPRAERKQIWPMVLMALSLGALSLEKHFRSLDPPGQVSLGTVIASWAAPVLMGTGVLALLLSIHRGRQQVMQKTKG